ncbi:DUF4142 domain-containing protein [Spirosoma sp. BT702]|uniref:DUF4142 domain-containing protein n=1 Tax=Spirosoma profusum TaxID=2771354 RepID=A0A926Y148_9BACT|nr:DUF4142 domain-containing protein [Spirosoma profusum]MBD2701583.1 DUF4142 domain-containing protein [Spirosoma profusum]
MKTLSVYVILFVVSVLLGSCRDGELSEDDKKFMSLAGSAGIMEVEMGKLAQQRGVRPDVRHYGDQMVKEHTEINTEFLELAQRLQVEVPDEMNEDNQRMVRDLAALQGNPFDAKYIDTMIADHGLAVKLFQKAHDDAKNKAYKKWLAKMIPVVAHHLKMAENLKTSQPN